MAYWVEYSFQIGVRENLMTSDISKARRIVMDILGKHGGTANIFNSSRAELPLGNIVRSSMTMFVWIPFGHFSGKNIIPKRINRDGTLRK